MVEIPQVLTATFCPGNLPMRQLHLSVALLLAFWCADSAHGQSFGRWNLPSTTAQVFGYGNGAGHHAPMVRTPSCRPPRVARVTFQPCRNAPPAYVTAGNCGNGQCAVSVTPQHYQQPIPHPQIGQPFPTVAAPQSLFSPPTPAMPDVDSLPKPR